MLTVFKYSVQSFCNRKQSLAAGCSKAIQEARLVEGKFALFWILAVAGGRYTPAKGRLPSHPNRQRVRGLDRGRGLHGETARSALTVILQLVMDGWTSSILIVLGTVTLQSQGQCVPISLRLFSELGQLLSWLHSGPQLVTLLHLVEVSVSTHPQNTVCSPWEGTKGPWLCLVITLLLFVLLGLLSFVSACSHFLD